MDNVILTYNNIELYRSEIDILCDEYISTLNNPDMIYKSTVFSGMLQYIYNNKLKHIIPDTYNNDYKLLDDIFNNVYIYLCAKFNIVPSVLQFSVLCHIDRSALSDLRAGQYWDGSRVKPETCQTIRKWFDVCESMLVSRAANESSIGSIFVLKANYHYRDNDSTPVLQVTEKVTATPEQIKDRYSDVKKPEIPILE